MVCLHAIDMRSPSFLGRWRSNGYNAKCEISAIALSKFAVFLESGRFTLLQGQKF